MSIEKKIVFHKIAYIKTEFPSKFGIPRQSGLADTPGQIIFEEDYRNADAVRGMEQYSHLWLLWQFSEIEEKAVGENFSPTVRPPRLGGNERTGVFATRSPFRPNPIGLSCVKLRGVTMDERYGPVLHVSGADLMDGTPILDIKPYLPYVDAHPEARGGFSDKVKGYHLEVEIAEQLCAKIPAKDIDILKEILSQDPRPSYQNDPERIYGMEYGGMEIKFKVEDGKLIVCDISPVDGGDVHAAVNRT